VTLPVQDWDALAHTRCTLRFARVLPSFALPPSSSLNYIINCLSDLELPGSRCDMTLTAQFASFMR